MSEKTISFSVNTFRHYKDGDEDGKEFITFSAYSKNLEKAMQEVENYLLSSDNIHHSNYILMSEGDDIIWHITFYSDTDFYNFKAKVEDARLDDYKEWLLSNYKDGARESVPASNGESSEGATEGNG